MLGHELVLSNIHQELCLFEVLNAKGITHFLDSLLGKGSNVYAENHNCVAHVFCPHAVGVDLDGLDSDLFVFWEEAK
jgi:hypothetical protein